MAAASIARKVPWIRDSLAQTDKAFQANKRAARAERKLQRERADRARVRDNARYMRRVRAADRARGNGPVRRRGAGLTMVRSLRGAPTLALLAIGAIAFISLGGLQSVRGALAPTGGGGGGGGTLPPAGPNDITDPIDQFRERPPPVGSHGGGGPPPGNRPPNTPSVIFLQGAPTHKAPDRVPGTPTRLVLPGVPYSAGASLKAPPTGIENPRIGDFIKLPQSNDVGDRIVRDLTRLYYPRTGDGVRGLTGPERIALGERNLGTRELERRVQAARRAGTIAPTPRNTQGTGTFRDPIRTRTRSSGLDFSRFTNRAPGSPNILGGVVPERTLNRAGGRQAPKPTAPPEQQAPQPSRTPRRTNTPGVPSTARGREIYNAYLRYRGGR